MYEGDSLAYLKATAGGTGLVGTLSRDGGASGHHLCALNFDRAGECAPAQHSLASLKKSVGVPWPCTLTQARESQRACPGCMLSHSSTKANRHMQSTWDASSG